MGSRRAMENDLRKRIKQAGPGGARGDSGLQFRSQAGDRFVVVPNTKTAKALVEENVVKGEEDQNLSRALTLEGVMSHISAGDVKELNLIIKADAQGSVEAVRGSLERLDSPSARVNILHSSPGGVNEGDVLLARRLQRHHTGLQRGHGAQRRVRLRAGGCGDPLLRHHLSDNRRRGESPQGHS